MTAPLAVEALAAGYGARDVLADVTRTFGAGRVTALLGENGAGKSTLLKALAGIVPARRGTIRLGGRLLSGIPRREAARALGYLPQGFEPLFPILARDLVLLGRTPVAHGVRRALGARPRGRRSRARRDGRPRARRDRSRRDERRRAPARPPRTRPRRRARRPPPRRAGREPRSAPPVPRDRRDAAPRGPREARSSSRRTSWTSPRRAPTTRCSSPRGRVLAAGPIVDTLTEPLLSALFGVEACVGAGRGRTADRLSRPRAGALRSPVLGHVVPKGQDSARSTRPEDELFAGRGPVPEMRGVPRGALPEGGRAQSPRVPEVRFSLPAAGGRAHAAPARGRGRTAPLRRRPAHGPAQVQGQQALSRPPEGVRGEDGAAGRDPHGEGHDRGRSGDRRDSRLRLHGRLDGLGRGRGPDARGRAGACRARSRS